MKILNELCEELHFKSVSQHDFEIKTYYEAVS